MEGELGGGKPGEEKRWLNDIYSHIIKIEHKPRILQKI